jgi:TRAP-type mannitol/chloroaromatic compound transport system permease large subunit
VLLGLYIVYQIVVAWLRPKSSPAIPRGDEDGGRELWRRIVRALIPPIVLIVAVLGSILAGVATPTEAAAVGAVGAILLGGLRLGTGRGVPIYLAGLSLVGMLALAEIFDLRIAREVIGLGDRIGIYLAGALCVVLVWGLAISLVRVYRAGVLQEVSRATMRISAMVFAILIGAAMFSLVFRGLGGDELVYSLLSNVPGGAAGAMVVVMLVMFVLGFFLDFIEITFVVVPIIAPVLLRMDINPIWLGVMMAVNLQTSFLTPPFGFALFYLRGVAPREITTGHIYRGVVPFVLIQLAALGVLAAFPKLVTWLPKLIFG